MKNFEYQSLTKIIFGKYEISKLDRELEAYNVKKMLLVYGRNSIKNLGIYKQVLFICEKLGIEVFEESNVRPNPEMNSVRSGINTCKKNDIDFILAAGGGSVIDCAKAIAFGTLYDGDPWDIYLLKDKAKESLPLGVIITLAATGTETNGNSVISNDETNEKRSVAYPFSIPKFAIIDPSYTLSVSRHHVIAGSMDIMMHVFEQYFSNTLRTETSDYMSMGIIKSVIENTQRYLSGEDSYETRANISWASTIGLNWILGIDKVGDWATHRLSYPITKEYEITHGYALALIFTSWIRVTLKYNSTTMIPRLVTLGEMIFDESDYQKVPGLLEELFESWGAKVRLSDELENVSETKINEIIETALALGSVGTVVKIDKEKALEIFKDSLGW
jgi:alcohol dehydrogenase YqhD (iron-dependent ADH family)